MPEKLDRCVKRVMSEGKTEEQAYAICNASLKGHFTDSMDWNPDERTAVSVRDGVLEYAGIELGLSPPDKMFTVYRSPATIANVASKLPGICLIDGHIDPEGPPVTEGIGRITHADMIDLIDESTDSKLAIRNKIYLDSVAVKPKSQLSLGYTAELVPHDKYDFEQREIQPHHLAVVQAGRCGSSCSFIDHKYPTEGKDMKTPKQTPAAAALHKVFTDQEGQPNLEQIVEIATELPEALRKLPVDELQKVLPALQEIVNMAGGSSAPTGEGMESEVVVEDEDMPEKEEKVPMQDTAEFKDAMAKVVDSAIKRHSQVVDKAKNFVDEAYSFEGKSTEQVMRDALATQFSDKFADSELDIAFKMLRQTKSTVAKFGDGAPSNDRFASVADKEC